MNQTQSVMARLWLWDIFKAHCHDVLENHTTLIADSLIPEFPFSLMVQGEYLNDIHQLTPQRGLFFGD